MSSNGPDGYAVHLGAWTNWSRGTILGATVTMTRRDANLLIAFIAFFVAWVGTRAWRIVCLWTHFAYSAQGRTPQDALYHQRQALLRNAANPESALLTMGYLSAAWGMMSARNLSRLLPVILLALVCTASFSVASIFSSAVSSSMGTDVLLSGENCQVLNGYSIANATADELSRYYYPYASKHIKDAANYAQQCYGNTGLRVLGCDTFPQRSFTPAVIQTDAPCPFADTRICKSQDKNLFIDSGLLDSHDDFGCNAPGNERMKYRSVLHCAPLVTEGYSTIVNTSTDRSYKKYYYGASYRNEPGDNTTYMYPADNGQALNESNYRFNLPEYYVGTKRAIYDENGYLAMHSTFDPFEGFQGSDITSDIHLFFLSSNGMRFSSRGNDPWYNATRPGGTMVYFVSPYSTDTKSSEIIYHQVEPAAPLACKTQQQWCYQTPQGQQCSKLGPFYDATDTAINGLWETDEVGSNRLFWFFRALTMVRSDLSMIVSTLGPQSLLARDGVANGMQGPIPENQWMIDVQYWHSVSLASYQRSIVSAASGVKLEDPEMFRFINSKPNATEEVSMCNNQKIRSTLYVSFSLFGIYFIFSFGSVIILVSFVLDPLFSQLRKKFGVKSYQQLEWRVNETLQLQRLAHEELGLGTWTKGSEVIPLTQAGETLASLNLVNPEHPRLLCPDSEKLPDQLKPVAEVLVVQTVSNEDDDFTAGSEPETPIPESRPSSDDATDIVVLEP